MNDYLEVKAYLKKLNFGTKPKKSPTFTLEDFKRFITAPDNMHLMHKVKISVAINIEYD